MKLSAFTPEQEYAELRRVRLANVVDVHEPLVLISQVSRSGGTLLSHLFDSHPQCHPHPHELKIGHPRKQSWPILDLDHDPETWFEILFEPTAARHFIEGYSKHGVAQKRERGPAEGSELYPFLFLPGLQRELFLDQARARRASNQRDVLNWYMTSFFNAWIDNQTLYAGPKRIVVGFTPGMHMWPDSLERFFDAYPDGHLVSLVRDPRTWYASARRHNPRRYSGLEAAHSYWLRSTETTIAARERYGPRAHIVAFEDLVLDTATVMRRLAEAFGIEFAPSLLEPTFNGFQIKANSTEAVGGYGVLSRPVERTDELERTEIRRIEELTGTLYEQALGLSG